MNFKLNAFLLAILILCVLVIRGLSITGGVHNFKNECSFCHLGIKEPNMLTGSPDFLCKNCHEDIDKRSHPSDFFVKRVLPKRFPLFNNKMTCITCHYAHKSYGSKDTQKRKADNYPYLLRYKKAGKEFCIQCHSVDDICNNCEPSHSVSFGVAHVKFDSPEILKILDRSSRDCMTCHNGVIASNADGGGTQLSWNHLGGIGLSHPIGVNYEEVYRKSPNFYHPPQSLPPQIKLINGKVECLTCHDHYSKLKGKLVMSNRGSKLCLSCHNL
ncbi:conserved hypothetical protein [Thermotomaculum hydrothermale]|uniref:Doubled CXXCH motif domain-containing protein n=1 Tax=Thermotomaculum hydrothermale TaxID=981385 RepID=A0A7R6PXY4_9BACT|nr:cytochrome c3 family protein [Thermotomaculum hydrothermale]BBB32825.1 conserved hypothetical protein [Thermotomaculum hydrothermale]